MEGTTGSQPPMPPAPFRPRPGPNAALRALRRGWAVCRLILLIAITGFGAAAVVAAAAAALIIAINGSLK